MSNTGAKRRSMSIMEASPPAKRARRVTMDGSHPFNSHAQQTKTRKQKKVGWSKEEDELLRKHVQAVAATNTAEPKWTAIAETIGSRTGKQCRERWYQHLRPGLVKGNWTAQEDALIAQLQGIHGNKWSKIAESMPHRTDNDIKNRWNSKKKQEMNRAKKLKLMAAAGGASNASKVPKKPTGRRIMTSRKQKNTNQPVIGKQLVMATQQPPILSKAIHTTKVLGPKQNIEPPPTKQILKSDATTPFNIESFLLGPTPLVERDFGFPPLCSPSFPSLTSPTGFVVPSSLMTPSPFLTLADFTCTPMTFNASPMIYL